VGAGIFGTLVERRFGTLAVVATFILSGAAGAGLAVLLETPPLLSDAPFWTVMGANGPALGLLVAWLVDDRLAARRGDDRENDLLGVYVIAAVLVLLSLTTEPANIAAAVGGALAGALLGLVLPRLTRTR
jgi:membrane associated rhomboid family serine protease